MTLEKLLATLDELDGYHQVEEDQAYCPWRQELADSLTKAGVQFVLEDNLLVVYFKNNV